MKCVVREELVDKEESEMYESSVLSWECIMNAFFFVVRIGSLIVHIEIVCIKGCKK